MIYVFQRSRIVGQEQSTETTYIMAETQAEAQKNAGYEWEYIGRHNTQEFLKNEAKIQRKYKKDNNM